MHPLYNPSVLSPTFLIPLPNTDESAFLNYSPLMLLCLNADSDFSPFCPASKTQDLITALMILCILLDIDTK